MPPKTTKPTETRLAAPAPEATISGEINERILVRVETSYDTAFLKFFGLADFTVQGEYTALVSRDVG